MVLGRPPLAQPGFECDVVAAEGVAWAELDRFFTAQTESRLQPHAQADVFIVDLRELRLVQGLGLGLVGDQDPGTNAVGTVLLGDDARFVHLAGPPAEHGEAILERAGADALLAPAGDQCFGLSETDCILR
jgi:hypothetical protein